VESLDVLQKEGLAFHSTSGAGFYDGYLVTSRSPQLFPEENAFVWLERALDIYRISRGVGDSSFQYLRKLLLQQSHEQNTSMKTLK